MNKSIAWSPDSKKIAIGSDDGIIRIWDVEDLKIHNTEAKKRHDREISKLQDAKFRERRDREISKPLIEYEGHSGDINTLTWSSNGTMLASGSDDHTICLWNTVTDELIYTFIEHTGSINYVVWSPNGKILASASSDKTIRIWNIEERNLLSTIIGHSDAITYVTFSHDSSLLASKSLDGTVCLWRADTSNLLTTLNEPFLSYGRYSGLAFHPHALLLANAGGEDPIIHIWQINPNAFTDIPPIQYTNAKVVLVGDSGMGKTGLGMVLTNHLFERTDSTHSRNVWPFDYHQVELPTGQKEIHETFLWDLAGQLGYRLTHQLHLKNTDLAVIVFDRLSEADPFLGIHYWDRALRSARQTQTPQESSTKIFLVAARIDRGRKGVSQQRMDRLLHDLQLDKGHYFETSAKDGRGVIELSEAIKKAIDWKALQKVSFTPHFQNIKKFLLALKENSWQMETIENLYRAFLSSPFFDSVGEKDLRYQFTVCLNLLEAQGLIQQLNFGNYVLLQPELLDYYASALVAAVEDEPDDVGSIAEYKVRSRDFFIPDDNRLKDDQQEENLLNAVIEHLVRHDIILRESTNEGLYLIFPSQSTRELQDDTTLGEKFATFHFKGAVLNIYTTLVVSLSGCGFFKKEELWRGIATFIYACDPFYTATSGRYAIFLHDNGKGDGELVLYFAESEETNNQQQKTDMRSSFESFVLQHLQSHALSESVRRQDIVRCSKCRRSFEQSAIQHRRESGKSTIRCQFCDVDISLFSDTLQLNSLQQSVVNEMVNAADSKRKEELEYIHERDRLRKQSKEKIRRGEYDVFLCYNYEDKPVVKKIGEQLKDKGYAPWLDVWDLIPGRPRQPQVQKQIENIRSAAVFIGKNGIAPWHEIEIEALLRQFVKRDCPVIPTLLEDASQEPVLPPFLGGMEWVKFRKQKSFPDPNSSSPKLQQPVEKRIHIETIEDNITNELIDIDVIEYIEDDESKHIEKIEQKDYEQQFPVEEQYFDADLDPIELLICGIEGIPPSIYQSRKTSSS